jgi:choline dehydrogenase
MVSCTLEATYEHRVDICSSAYNAMIYQRGSAGSYDMWADMVGDDDYKWENFLPFFAKSANFSIETRPDNATIPAQGEGAFIQGAGPVHVEYPQYAAPFSSWAQLGMIEAGFEEISDFCSGVLIGTQYAPMTANPTTGERDSSQTSFLNAAVAAGQPITVYDNTMAQKINFNSSKAATSVLVSSECDYFNITARKEIIISAGTFQSPQLLMVSGIGPAATLEEFDIPVISDLAGVGQNMWDHVFYGMIWPTDMETRQSLLNTTYADLIIEEYHETHQTIMSSNALDYFGWEKFSNRTQFTDATLTDLDAFPADWPEIEYISGSLANAALPSTYHDYTVMIPAMVAPTSRGSITISSSSMDDQPVIDPNWLSTAADQEQAVAALKRVREIMATDAIQGGLVGPEIAPGATVQTDEEILAYIMSSFSTVWHAACTCKFYPSPSSLVEC